MGIKGRFSSRAARWEFLAFLIFLTGSTIISYKLGRWVAIGVALEYLSLYIIIKTGAAQNHHLPEIKEDPESEVKD